MLDFFLTPGPARHFRSLLLYALYTRGRVFKAGSV
jgi:hypothetical protein